MSLKTLIINDMKNTLRKNDNFIRYNSIYLDLSEIPEEYHDDIMNDIDICFYNYDDTIYYYYIPKYKSIIIQFDYNYYKFIENANMIMKAKFENDILYMTYKRSDTLIPNNKIYNNNSSNENEIDLIPDMQIQIYNQIIIKYSLYKNNIQWRWNKYNNGYLLK
jgi:hypothetical protein